MMFFDHPRFSMHFLLGNELYFVISMVSVEEDIFFKQEAIKQIERAQNVNNLLAIPIEMVDITAFCPICRTFSLRFSAKQNRSPDEAENFIKSCLNGCKVK